MLYIYGMNLTKTEDDEETLTRSFTFIMGEKDFQRVTTLAKADARTKGYIVREAIKLYLRRKGA